MFIFAKKINKMSTTTKKNKKIAPNGVQAKGNNYVIDPQTGEKISKAGYFFRKMRQKPMVQIVDMRAVLK